MTQKYHCPDCNTELGVSSGDEGTNCFWCGTCNAPKNPKEFKKKGQKNSRSVFAFAPASTANLGSSFDCLSIALNLFCEVKITESKETKTEIIYNDQIENIIPNTYTELMQYVNKLINSILQKIEEIKEIKKSPTNYKITIKNDIPIGVGLGSSAALLAATLKAVNSFFDLNLSNSQLLKIGVEFEKHQDNLAAALYGGLVISATTNENTPIVYHVDNLISAFDDKSFVVLIPHKKTLTNKSRQELFDIKTDKKHRDYLKGLNRSVANILAFATGDMESLKYTTKDNIWHQHYRTNKIRYFKPVVNAALKAGAYGAALSGSGSSIIAIVDSHKAEAVRHHMERAYASTCSLPPKTKILKMYHYPTGDKFIGDLSYRTYKQA